MPPAWGPDWLRETDHAALAMAIEVRPDDPGRDRGGRSPGTPGDGPGSPRPTDDATLRDGLRLVALQGVVSGGAVPARGPERGTADPTTPGRRDRSIELAHPDGCLDAIAAGCDWTDWDDPNIEAILSGKSYDLAALERSRTYAEAERRASMSKAEWEAREAERAALDAGKAPKRKAKASKKQAALIR